MDQWMDDYLLKTHYSQHGSASLGGFREVRGTVLPSGHGQSTSGDGPHAPRELT